MAGQVDIINMAYGKLAQDRGISSLADQTKEARTATRVWDTVRDIVLEARNWPFALKAEALALDAEAPQPGWLYRYSVPAECLTLKAVVDEAGLRSQRHLSGLCEPDYLAHLKRSGAYDYDMAYGANGTSILSDLPQAYAVYVMRVTDTGRFPAHFIDALACRLAAELAPPIIGEQGLRVRQTILERDYMAALSLAAEHSMNQTRTRLEPVTPALAARA